VRQLLARRPPPLDRLVIRTAEPLRPDARYLVQASDLRNLSGAAGTSQQLLLVPPRAAPDTGRIP
jgi:hypothetical protein